MGHGAQGQNESPELCRTRHVKGQVDGILTAVAQGDPDFQPQHPRRTTSRWACPRRVLSPPSVTELSMALTPTLRTIRSTSPLMRS